MPGKNKNLSLIGVHAMNNTIHQLDPPGHKKLPTRQMGNSSSDPINNKQMNI